MPYIIPPMPLTVSIWRGYAGAVPFLYNAPDVVTIGNLAYGNREVTHAAYQIFANSYPHFFGTLLLPAGTDIQPFVTGAINQGDVVEVPSLSQRFYIVVHVDDYGKGFANEHRFAIIRPQWAQLNFNDVGLLGWVFPIP